MHLIRRYFIAGLLVWLPIVATYLVISFAVRTIDKTLLLLPVQYRPESLIGFEIPGLGVILTVALISLTGLIVANFFGRKLVDAWEAVLSRIPLVRSVYGAVKQIAVSLFADTSQSFREVILVEYPRKGLWVLAFVTGDTPKKFKQAAGVDLINIYVPTTPNPTSGFYIMMEPSEVLRLDIPVEAGLKMILSAGVVNPLDNPEEMAKLVEKSKAKQKKNAAK